MVMKGNEANTRSRSPLGIPGPSSSPSSQIADSGPERLGKFADKHQLFVGYHGHEETSVADFEHLNARDSVAFLLGIAPARHQDAAEAELAGEVDEARDGDQIGDPLDALAKDVVGHAKRIDDRRLPLDHLK